MNTVYIIRNLQNNEYLEFKDAFTHKLKNAENYKTYQEAEKAIKELKNSKNAPLGLMLEIVKVNLVLIWDK